MQLNRTKEFEFKVSVPVYKLSHVLCFVHQLHILLLRVQLHIKVWKVFPGILLGLLKRRELLVSGMCAFGQSPEYVLKEIWKQSLVGFGFEKYLRRSRLEGIQMVGEI